MIYVCDTHAFLWRLTSGRRLGRAAAKVFDRAERGIDEVRLTTISLFEIAMLVEKGRLKMALDWKDWLHTARATPGLGIEPLQPEDVEEARALPALVDPFDRLIAGTAVRLGVALLTADDRLARSRRVRVVWD